MTGSDDDSIRVYNTVAGSLQDTLYAKKYGVSCIKITHAPTCVLYATRKVRKQNAQIASVSLGDHHALASMCKRRTNQGVSAHVHPTAFVCVCVYVFMCLCVCVCGVQPPQSSHDPSWYSVRYHDLHRNEYVRFFRGHTAPITTVALSPKDDTFLSAGMVSVLLAYMCC